MLHILFCLTSCYACRCPSTGMKTKAQSHNANIVLFSAPKSGVLFRCISAYVLNVVSRFLFAFSPTRSLTFGRWGCGSDHLNGFFSFQWYTQPLTGLTRPRASQRVRELFFRSACGKEFDSLTSSLVVRAYNFFVYRPHPAVFCHQTAQGGGADADQMAIVIASRVTVLQLHILSLSSELFYDACPANWPDITSTSNNYHQVILFDGPLCQGIFCLLSGFEANRTDRTLSSFLSRRGE